MKLFKLPNRITLFSSKRFGRLVITKIPGDVSQTYYSTRSHHLVTWVLSGAFSETILQRGVNDWTVHKTTRTHKPSLLPFITKGSVLRSFKVASSTWVLTYAGPKRHTFIQYHPVDGSLAAYGPNGVLVRTPRRCVSKYDAVMEGLRRGALK